jgi:hypothetical protein
MCSIDHSSEFLEHTNVVPYPPPLFHYPWDKLKELERKMALTELQEISKMEARAQGVDTSAVGHDQRKEWRFWNKMDPYERKHAFEKLQVRAIAAYTGISF